jgi:lysophospholipase L1-like esterase
MSTRWLGKLVLAALLVTATACGGDDDDGIGSSASNDTSPSTGSESEAPAPTGDAVRYLAIGDSLSQGVGATDESTGSFPALLAEAWRAEGCEVELLDAGISGYTAGQMLAEQVPQIEEFSPTLITFQSGANDIVNGVTIDQYRDDVGAVLDAATASGARVFVLAQNEWFRGPAFEGYGEDLDEQRAAYDEVMIEEAAARGAEFLDLRDLYTQEADEELWVEDGIHPTPEVYESWAAELAELVPAPCDA